MTDDFSILIVDDEYSVRDSLFHWFKNDGYRVSAADSARAALEEFQKSEWDVVLLDIKMPEVDGMELQQRLREIAPTTVVIMITAHGTVETAVQALKYGAFDYLTKPVDPDELSRVVMKAVAHRRLQTENQKLKANIDNLVGQDEIVGQSAAMKKVLSLVDSLAATDVSVLIRGESGTGKEVIARAIHSRGSRRYFPLVPVNCGALPETLLEAELFGHERGAFTGARQRHKGNFEQANGGTLFLDEIGSVSAKTQVNLLRVLDTKEFTRIGGSQPLRVDFRLICATNQDLEQMVADKQFREDLYFRINVFRIDLPPLRERPGDIALLARHFMTRLSGQMEKRFTDFEPEALARLKRHPWPGNVRELANAIERAMVVGTGPRLLAEDLPFDGGTGSLRPADDSLSEIERSHIARILERTQWNVSQAAKTLGLDRATLYGKIKKYELRK